MATPKDPPESELVPFPAGSDISASPGGNPFVAPSFVDFSSLVPPFVDFASAFAFAQGLGVQNRETFFRNLAAARDPALGLLRTDILGIQEGASALAPFVRAQGDIDLQKNIERANLLDQFNLRRFPQLADFNRRQAEIAQRAQQRLHTEAVEASGVDFKSRILGVLDQLDEQRKGRLHPELEGVFTTDVRNRGAEIGAATGVTPLSRAGLRASQRLEVGERVGLSQAALQQIPGVATQAQAVLQAPVERPPTLFAQPTPVPLAVSNVADRLPVQSTLSAGATQAQLGGTATELEIIPATTGLSTNLQTQQFNEQARFVRDQFVLGEQQAQLTATDNAVQGAINADKGDAIRAEQAQMFQAGLDARRQSERLGAFTQLGGQLIGAAISSPGGLTGTIKDIAGGIGDLFEGIGSVFGTRDEVPVGQTSVNQAEVEDFKRASTSLLGGGILGGPAGVVSAGVSQGASAGQAPSAPQFVPELSSTPAETNLSGSFRRAAEPLTQFIDDNKNILQAGSLLVNWNQLSTSQQLSGSGQLGLSVAADKGFIDKAQERQIGAAINAVGTMADPNASTAQKIAAAGQIYTSTGVTSFTGDINNPTSINGNKVIGPAPSDPSTGDRAWITQDASGNKQMFSKGNIVHGVSTAAAIDAFSILASDADADKKIRALIGAGVPAAQANEVLSQVQAGNTLAALSVFNTFLDWNDMNPVQKAVSAIRTGSIVMNAVNSYAASGVSTGTGPAAINFFTGASPEIVSQVAATGTQVAGAELAATGAQTAAPTFGSQAATVLGGAAVVASTAAGVVGAVKTYEAVNKMPAGSKRTQSAIIGNAAAGAAIGVGVGVAAGVASGMAVGASIGSVFPVVGTAIGAVIGAAVGLAQGSFGSGKRKDQMMRDAWRDNLGKAGLAEKENGHFMVSLADGSKVRIGEGKTVKNNDRNINIDGSERHTHDVDWGDELQTGSIPEAHIWALATGIDPTGDRKLFHQAVGMGLNSASSNASSKEDVLNNFKAMMGDKIDPAALAVRIEGLRLSYKITDQEYGTYVDKLNEMFDTNIQKASREEAAAFFINDLSQKQASGEKLEKSEEKFYKLLTDSREQEKAFNKMQKRIDTDRRNLMTEEEKAEERRLIAETRRREETTRQVARLPRIR